MEQFPSSFCIGRTRITSREDDPSKVIANFSPDLYLQRYAAVLSFLNNLVENEDIRNVIEYGPNTFNFFYQSLEPVDWLETMNLVDIDREALLSGINLIKDVNNNRTKSNRVKSLTAHIFHGNMASEDHRMLNSDVVLGIEVIEHMTPSDFANFPQNVFGYIQPKYVVFTTPNRDFNVLFRIPEGKFRHYDHKFEFSRQEFRKWAEKIVDNYPSYEFSIYGIGPSDPDIDLDVGFASQMVIFKRNSNRTPEMKEVLRESYKLEATVQLNSGDSRTQKEKQIGLISQRLGVLLQEATYNDNYIVMKREWCEEGHEMNVIPATMLLKRLQQDHIQTDIDTLLKANHPSVTNIIYDVELTIALNLVFVCRNECDWYSHDNSFESIPGTLPPASFYSIVDTAIEDDCNTLPITVQLEENHRQIFHLAKQFLKSVELKGLYLNAPRESCEYDHSMCCVTTAMILAYLQTEGIKSDEETLITIWDACRNEFCPIEITSYGPVFLLRSSCPNKTPCKMQDSDSELIVP